MQVKKLLSALLISAALITPSIAQPIPSGGGGGSSSNVNIVSYTLLSNAAVSGPTVANVAGGGYILDLRGTIGGASIAVQVTNADGTFGTFTTLTATGTTGPFQIGAGSSVKAVVSGGSPSGLYLSLQGIGAANASVGPLAYTTTDKGGTVTTGGTAQAAIAANSNRKAWCIQNDPAATENMSVRVNGTASATTGTIVTPGNQACNLPGALDTAAVSVFAATTGHRWFGYEGQ